MKKLWTFIQQIKKVELEVRANAELKKKIMDKMNTEQKGVLQRIKSGWTAFRK